MKNDLKQLMKRENLKALWVMGPAKYNSAMIYLAGRGHVSGADLLYPAEGDPFLVCGSMEREEAAATGLDVKLYSDFDASELIEKYSDDPVRANALLKKKILEDAGLSKGRVAVYGKTELQMSWAILKKLEDIMPELTILGEGPDSILMEARTTKDSQEIKKIRRMGQITVDVVKHTASFLQESQVTKDQKLLDTDGTPLTIGKVKSKIRLWLAERGAETPEGTIFSMGRDAGIPHNAGNPQDQLELGKTIIFDIFPQEMGGGYFFDFTRTWCLGYAAPEIQKLYDDVAMVYRRIMGDLESGSQTREYQDLTCQYFEEAGHKTIRQDSKILSGYVHSLGHGLGLDVHERPSFGRGATSKDILAPGSVVTIEPGLYYPDQGMGCRLEDTVWVRPDGEMEILAEYSHELVLDMKHWKSEN